MSPRNASQKALYRFSLRVWVSSVVLGPVLWFFFPGMDRDPSVPAFFQYWLGCVVLALLFSWPSFLLFNRAVGRIDLRPWELSRKKLAAAGWAALLACLAAFFVYVPVWLLFHQQGESFMTFRLGIGIGCFIIPLIIAVYFFRWPANANAL